MSSSGGGKDDEYDFLFKGKDRSLREHVVMKFRDSCKVQSMVFFFLTATLGSGSHRGLGSWQIESSVQVYEK